ncbi:hypothetical protein DERP_006226 [Dermatophagoides pteronyssinus]|uniref:Uncharacterized protein n=1 Tax=Dermatophagoides pteronyssinus TaxID=6956 RepID=A0ABQ8IY68_DERPT|nr:hypothetical protein DERP_006226 [Dermatophagoides pteronyssinus]
MEAMHQLYSIEPEAFSQLPHLMSIYIKIAPKLQSIVDGVFIGISTINKLMHLKITHSGLERIPMIRQHSLKQQQQQQSKQSSLSQQQNVDEIISTIDFDNSRIRNITERSILINAESLNIEYNQIEFISNYAFYGSKIEKLSLKGNKNLVHLEEFAFAGLYLREL